MKFQKQKNKIYFLATFFIVTHNEKEDRRIRRLQARPSNENEGEHDRLVIFQRCSDFQKRKFCNL